MEKLRSEMNPEFFWDLSDFFESDKSFLENYKVTKTRVSNHKEELIKDADMLKELIDEMMDISMDVENLYVYANMKLHEDSNVSQYQKYADMVESLSVSFSEAFSYVSPMVVSLDENIIDRFIDDENYNEYRFYIENIIRNKPYILSKEVEAVLSSMGEVASIPENIYAMFNDTDSTFGTVTTENGEVTLTQGNYVSFLESKNRNIRKQAYENMLGYYVNYKNTLATMFASNVKTNTFYSKTRKFDSPMEQSLFSDNIPKEVYLNLIETVGKYTKYMHKYVQKRKEILGVDKIHFYDMYVPIVDDVDKEITYEEAKQLVLESVKVMGDDYIELANKAFNEKWIDVYENKGKRSGAYSWGSYKAHPYILLNYNNKLDDLFTLTHELGHALHSYYSKNNLPYIYASYTIFVAEIASTFNESLLLENMLEKSTDKNETKYLINHFLEQIRGTLFRQTLFAEFEMKAHDLYLNGEPLDVETLSGLYEELLVKYYGDDIIIDDYIRMEWARIPHFYSSFYVFQYATGISAGIAFNDLIKENGQSAVDKYKELLKSGEKDYSTNLLKKAGVDMTTSKPIESALKKFGELLEKF